jgi:RuvB-like protein 1 (pontin 52)
MEWIEACAHRFHSKYVLQLLTPASILAQLAGRTRIELEDINEMIELFLDAKTSASNLAKGGGFEV